MERVLYATGYVIGSLFAGIIGVIIGIIKSSGSRQTGLSLPLPIRFEHMHVIAGSGHGKTQLLQHLIATDDLPAVACGERSLIVLDSQGGRYERSGDACYILLQTLLQLFCIPHSSFLEGYTLLNL
jgi:hypothetical protein